MYIRAAVPQSPVRRTRPLVLPALLLASAPAWPAASSDGPLVLDDPQTAAPFPAGEWLVANEPSFEFQPIQLFRLDAGVSESNEYFSAGANVGNLPHQQSLAPSQGRVELGAGQTWVNEGRFWVGSHFGSQNSTGEVVFESGSQFVSSAVAFAFPELPKDVRIGQGGTGTVTVQAGARWLNLGLESVKSFTVGNRGVLQVEGELVSISDTSVFGVARVQGPDALWDMQEAFSLDIDGFGTGLPGRLLVSGGGTVLAPAVTFVGFESGVRGELVIGEDMPAVLAFTAVDQLDDHASNGSVGPALFAARELSIGEFGQGDVFVNGGGRLEVTQGLTLGRQGGSGSLVLTDGGEVLVGGAVGWGIMELFASSTVDLTNGGRLVVDSVTASLLDDPFETFDGFAGLAEGTVLVGDGGLLKGSGFINGSVLVGAGGTLAPGNSPGTLFIGNDLELAPGSTLVMEIAGTDPGLFDQLVVSGSLTLGGSLVLSFIDGFVPEVGESFTLQLFDALVFAGSFTDVSVEGLGDLALAFDPAALASGQPFQFSVVPVPAAAWLLASALGLLGLARRGVRA